MNKKGYPRGNPAEDCQKLQLWWEEEMQKCGLGGTVAIEHTPVSEAPPSGSTVKRLLDALGPGVSNTHLYGTTIPGAAWPLEAGVLTTKDGVVTDIIYRATLNVPLAAEVTFKKSPGLLSEKFELLGPGGERFKDQKPLLKKIKGGLNRSYDPPMFGYVYSNKTLQLEEASVALTPGPAGAVATIHSTARSEKAFIGHTYTLGLDKAIEILDAIDQACR
jgi:hypothetical protein